MGKVLKEKGKSLRPLNLKAEERSQECQCSSAKEHPIFEQVLHAC